MARIEAVRAVAQRLRACDPDQALVEHATMLVEEHAELLLEVLLGRGQWRRVGLWCVRMDGWIVRPSSAGGFEAASPSEDQSRTLREVSGRVRVWNTAQAATAAVDRQFPARIG